MITSRSVLMLLPSESLEHLQTEAQFLGQRFNVTEVWNVA
jgi:hypothetical protein